jgi:AraC-like DNA-binding protein
MNFSDFLSKKLNYDYTYLANIFSELEGKTIEQNIISHKIERVKELLTFNEMNLTEIAFNMHYSSVAHLSNQFKKTTGITTSNFKLSLNNHFKEIYKA